MRGHIGQRDGESSHLEYIRKAREGQGFQGLGNVAHGGSDAHQYTDSATACDDREVAKTSEPNIEEEEHSQGGMSYDNHNLDLHFQRTGSDSDVSLGCEKVKRDV